MKSRILSLLSLFPLLIACNPEEYSPVVKDGYEINPPVYFGDYQERIPNDNPITKNGFALGRKLFYETALSADNSISCGTCHQQELAFTDGKAVSEGVEGKLGKVSAMSLSNLLWTENFTWTGKFNRLTDQSLDPIKNPVEMHLPLEQAVEKLEEQGYATDFQKAFGSYEITVERIGKALAQFQRALISSDSRYDQYLRGEIQASPAELNGMNLFFTHPIPGQLRGANCGDCHLGPLTSGDIDEFQGFHNNGLDTDETMDSGLMSVTGKPEDKGRFKAPTLRNIAVTAPYMHDGRFKTLKEVMDHYNSGIKNSKTLDILIIEGSNEPVGVHDEIRLHLTEKEKEDVIAFLHMLTDESFLNNPKFSNPH
ncbi:cytochrome c peroxidase [Marivirga sericea]|uniref:Cytochrome c peroxidase n=1 Tax=Marivirga sericea TaxID=1028 RepID=A0A1X7KH98_9BACT|nr:cytochrome c peroxidase [Marivirga sericea]SMG40558.1 cytochrome c peroxidase [Marivirga sericea]